MDANWLLQNMGWEAGTAILMTIVARMFRWTTGKTMKRQHEIAFWSIGFFGLFGILTTIHFGIIKPIHDKIGTARSYPPDLHCSLSQGAVLTPYGTTPPMVLYLLKVVNSGGPSIVWNWKLRATLAGNEKIEVNAAETPVTESFINPANNQFMFRLESTNYFPTALLDEPLANGAGKHGWVEFPISTAAYDDLTRIGNVYVLEFQDCRGNVTSMTNYVTQAGGKLSDAP
jgi:hypothetical protein